MRRTYLTLALGLVAAAVVGWSDAARAQCNMPLVISQSSGTAKVLIILDSSGSMNEAIMSPSYNRTTTYSGRFTSGNDYSISSDGNYTPRSFNSSWPSTPTAYLVNSDRGEDGVYKGNYLNWVFFNATATQRAAIPTQTRIQAGKQGVNTLISTLTNVAFGVMKYNDDNGGDLIAPIGTSVSSMQAQVNNIRAESWTPLAETLVSALDYFKTTGASAPITDSCQRSFTILVTDGMPTHDLNVPSYLRDYDGDRQDPGNCTSLNTGYPNSYDCSGYVDDVAAYMYRNDLRPDMAGVQNVPVFCIGFDITAPLLQHTADNGGGEYYTVTNVDEFVDALTMSLNTIATRVAAGTSVSVVSSEDRQNNRLFRARYESQTWKGFVESFALPYHSGDAPLWEAGQVLSGRSTSSRQIFTSTNGTSKLAFSSTNSATLQAPLGAASVAAATTLINYVRGDSITGFRGRSGWKLGDIVDAAPVVVGKPAAYFSFLNYSTFRQNNVNRNEVLYVAANDGMLHCFDSDDGSELWGYVPKNQLPRLVALTDPGYCHDYFVNMTPAVYDIYTGGSWKTVLIGGQERGGTGLFAINVTNPDPAQISLMWDLNIAALNGSWNTPTLVRDRIRNAQVLAVGTGYMAASTQANLLCIDPANGSVLATLALGTAATGNKITRGTAVDIDLDGYDDRLYVCDLTGRVWRVNLGVSPWTATLLFNAGKPIQATPIVTMDELGRPMIFFGTGRYLTGTDPTSTESQRLFGIVDNGTSTAITYADLVDQTSTISAVPSSKRGWYMNLAIAGERITRTPALIAGVLYVPSFLPTTGGCGSVGQSWLLSVDYKDGSAPSNANGTENQTTAGRSQAMGDGILADPSVDLINEDIILQSSNAVLLTQNINAGLRRLIVRSWRQKLN